jgi:hypothetical protein
MLDMIIKKYNDDYRHKLPNTRCTKSNKKTVDLGLIYFTLQIYFISYLPLKISIYLISLKLGVAPIQEKLVPLKDFNLFNISQTWGSTNSRETSPTSFAMVRSYPKKAS